MASNRGHSGGKRLEIEIELNVERLEALRDNYLLALHRIKTADE